VLDDRGDEAGILGATRAHRRQHPIQRGVAAVLVVEVDRGENVEIALPKPRGDAGGRGW